MDPFALLGPAGWSDFREAYRDRRAIIHTTADSSDRFDRLWTDWELEAVCRFTPLPQQESFRLLVQRRQIPVIAFTDRMGAFRIDAFRQLRAGGASVVLGDFELYSNAALALTRAFEAELRVPVKVNVYVTPGHQQGLGAHVDPHDVLILQIQGAKEWDIYSSSSAAAPPSTRTLQPGSWLYLPKGVRHEVRNRASRTSVHFTVGFHPLTWGEVIQRALQQARVAAPVLNEALPADTRAAEVPAATMRRLESILPFVNLPEALAGYYADFPAMAQPVPTTGCVERARLERAGPMTRFHWNGDAVLSRQGAALPQVRLSYRRMPLVLRHDLGETLSWMEAAGAFCAGSIPLADNAGAMLLCKFLTNVGVLQVAEAASDGTARAST